MTQYLGNMDSLDAIVKFDEHCIIVVLTKTSRITTDSRIFAAVFTDIFLGYVFLKKNWGVGKFLSFGSVYKHLQ